MKAFWIFLLLFSMLCIASCPGAGDKDEIPVFPGMGLGINIGNSLDCIGTNTWTAGETGWGNPAISRDYVKALKGYGYKTIRLPVTWAERMGPGPNYTIDKAWMDRVEEVVNWILAENMYCIINLHHDGGESDKSWILNAGNDPEGTAKQFAAVWKQIADRFSGASDKLIYEAMNEVGFNKLWNQWNSATLDKKPEAYRILNMLNQTFVDTIRASSSNNATRHLLVSGYFTDVDQTCDPLFSMPNDTVEGRLFLSVHYYTPATFCILERDADWGKNRTDWGNDADYVELSRQFNKLKTNFIDKGIQVILGEYGVSFNNKLDAGRARWINAVTKTCLDNGICPILWDTGNDIKRLPPYAMSNPLKAAWDELKK